MQHFLSRWNGFRAVSRRKWHALRSEPTPHFILLCQRSWPSFQNRNWPIISLIKLNKAKKKFPTVLLAKRWRALQVPNDELPVGDWQVQRRGLEILLSGSLFFVHQLELQSRKLEWYISCLINHSARNTSWAARRTCWRGKLRSRSWSTFQCSPSPPSSLFRVESAVPKVGSLQMSPSQPPLLMQVHPGDGPILQLHHALLSSLFLLHCLDLVKNAPLSESPQSSKVCHELLAVLPTGLGPEKVFWASPTSFDGGGEVTSTPLTLKLIGTPKLWDRDLIGTHFFVK